MSSSAIQERVGHAHWVHGTSTTNIEDTDHPLTEVLAVELPFIKKATSPASERTVRGWVVQKGELGDLLGWACTRPEQSGTVHFFMNDVDDVPVIATDDGADVLGAFMTDFELEGAVETNTKVTLIL